MKVVKPLRLMNEYCYVSNVLIYILCILGKPTSPIIIEAICEETSARMKWKSSFNGGAMQFFFVVALSEAHQTVSSNTVRDKGENQTHQAVVPFLRPSVLYTFYVFAKNRHGVTSSDPLNCTTSNGNNLFKDFSYYSTWGFLLACTKLFPTNALIGNKEYESLL